MLRRIGGQCVDLRIDLVHRMELPVRDHFYGGGPQGLVLPEGGELEIAAHIQIFAAAAVGGAGVRAEIAGVFQL